MIINDELCRMSCSSEKSMERINAFCITRFHATSTEIETGYSKTYCLTFRLPAEFAYRFVSCVSDIRLRYVLHFYFLCAARALHNNWSLFKAQLRKLDINIELVFYFGKDYRKKMLTTSSIRFFLCKRWISNFLNDRYQISKYV